MAGKIKAFLDSVVGSGTRARLRMEVRRCVHFGFARVCSCCNSRLRAFKPFGLIPRPEARCPVCGALERHRLIQLYFKGQTDLFDGRPKRMLHVAPEPQLSRLFQRTKSIDYLSADLANPRAMMRMDITQVPFPDNSFDVIYCSHVLEHVPDDQLAMREFLRILKPGGWAVLQVPITAERTVEDPSVTDPKERERLFGQDDHVRRYGLDYVDRLRTAGFAVEVDDFVRRLPVTKVKEHALMANESIYMCRKLSAKSIAA